MKALHTLIAVFLLCVVTSASAVDIEEVVWGFDGRVVPYQFNPLSVLVSNTTEEEVHVKLQLIRTLNAGGDRLGAKVEEVVFLSPFSSRWVQFYPFVSDENDDWRVSWGLLPSQGKDLKRPRLGPPARIALVEANQISSKQKTGVKTLPEELFPTFVSGTESLEVVYLDHVPRWQEARRTALLDWVKRGGTVFLSPNAAGEYPVFSGELSALNSPLDNLRLGQGQVIRAASQADASVEANRILEAPVSVSQSSDSWDLSTNFFSQLRSITSPDHNWFMIHLMSLIYLGLVFPGWYLLSRRPTHFRTTLLAFVGVAALFTMIFNIIGRRGYGESTSINSLAIARQIEAGSYDVMQWTNVFVTGGDVYELTYDGKGDVFSTGPGFEKVPGVIDNGLDGRFLADIPLFSSRAFLHRGKMSGPEWKAEVTQIETAEKSRGGKKLTKLRLKIDPVPKGDRPFVIFGDQLYYLYAHEGEYELSGSAKPISESLAVNNDFDARYPYNNYRYQDSSPDMERMFSTLRDPVVGHSLGLGYRKKQTPPFYLPTDRIRLFLYEDIPQSFGVRHSELQAKQGKVLYSIDLWVTDEVAEFPDLINERDDDDEREDDEREPDYESGLPEETIEADETERDEAEVETETETENENEETTDVDE